MSTDHQQTATAISTSTPQQQRPRPQSNSLGHKSDDTNTSNSAYRPCSPDLSAYLLPSFPRQQAQPPPPQQYNQQQQQSLFRPSYKDHSSTHSEYSGPSSWQQRQGSSGTALTGLPSGGAYQLATHRGSYDANPYFSPQASFCQGELQRRETFAYGSVSGGRGEYSRLTYSPTAVVGGERFGPVEEIPPPQQQHQPQQLQHLPTQGQQGSRRTLAQDKLQGQGQALILQPYPSSISEQQHQQQQPMRNMPVLRRKRAPSDGNGDGGDHEYTPEASAGRGAGEGGASAKPSRKKKSDSGQTWTVGRAPGETGPSLGIDIKTKFPVARIKRIMQADEDVGKVAQATPTAVCELLTLPTSLSCLLRMLTHLFSFPASSEST